MPDWFEHVLLIFRMGSYLIISVIVFHMARIIDRQSGNGAKTALAEIMWSFGFMLLSLFIVSALKLIADYPFDAADILTIPIIATIIIMIRVYNWDKSNHG